MKFRLKVVALIAFALLAFAGNTFAQSKNITEKEYWAGIYTGYTSAHKSFPRRETTTYERLTVGRVTYSRIEKSEYEAANKYHTVKETQNDGKTSKNEMIQIGTIRYCKENSGEWRISGCYNNPPAALEDAIETHFVLQTNKDKITYIRTASYLSKQPGKTEPTKFLTEDKLILNSDLTIRERTIVKSVQETKQIASRETEKFEYRMSLKPIEPPIK